jgi:CBS domain containing-hemolysin-like protein
MTWQRGNHRGRDVKSVREDVNLDLVFKEFMTSSNHMLLVRRAPDLPSGPDGEVVGLITLEDVMEELIQARGTPLHVLSTP